MVSLVASRSYLPRPQLIQLLFHKLDNQNHVFCAPGYRQFMLNRIV